ncbi:hypothetical protein CCR83_03035 [Rhodobacter veldkampii DSM 11550]|uniref:Mth938-like domain-containing protein n=1 Tax=Phaeovulum veldkampii DSM 11550 TaxID=1185920 RepID=A0A2T4JKB9_9RHOB|nr:Mth938-like domain-containing protein [Phaeovulum veldkampii]MBK5945447.1 hypothetical protein [Phaeovulum veldkampii DSM 11550]PTE18313.1 hypothetical protein C5F46_05070 [Phaeovulum veldkampii DSM 11550]TDQ57792.1 uncharacterized protein EV658_11159 [Phaeovulum veldkampii DSM 11550]
MPIIDTSFGTGLPIDAFGPGYFRVAGAVRPGGLVIGAGAVADWAGYDDLAPVLALAGSVDLVFIGTGADISFAPKALVQRLEGAGLMVEAMATPAAARSYNLLLTENRRVAAALLPMPGVGDV